LLRRPPERPGRYVALLRIEGDIIEGRSGRPPIKPPVPIPFVLSVRSGDLTVVQQARRVLKDKRAAALVVHVDSGGGSAAASEAMAAALAKVAERKPVIVAMGAVAASGGYYVSTPGQHIVAQPGTITGSIGVLSGKIVSAGMFEKLLMNRELLARGRHAAMYDPGRPFSDEEREIVWRHIQRTYDVFLDRVSQSRKLSRDDVDKIGGGRVWTGRQALEHGLVDELGDLDVAIRKARQLAKLDERASVREVPVTEKRALAPQTLTSAALYSYALEGFRTLWRAQALYLCPFMVRDEFDRFG
jgi:protease-4